MDNREFLKSLYAKLSPEDRKNFLEHISDDLKTEHKIEESNFDELMLKSRFSEGVCCPHCGTTHIGPHGQVRGKKRYICYDCKKTFGLTTKSVFNGHKVDMETYIKYIELMIHQVPIRKAAKLCGISRTTAFIWRHKFLDTLAPVADKVTLGGIVEADETYFKISFKGSKVMPRASHKRGNWVNHKGLGEEFVCVPCAIERGNPTEKLGVIAKPTNLSSPHERELLQLFENRIQPGSILCVDKKAEYVSVADQLELQTVQLKPTKNHKAAVIKTDELDLHINHINSYHSNVKKFIAPFRGVATKYLPNYLNWNNFMNQVKSDDPKEFLTYLFANQISTQKSKEVQYKPPIPFTTRYDNLYSVRGVFDAGKIVKLSKKPITLDDPLLQHKKFNPFLGKKKDK